MDPDKPGILCRKQKLKVVVVIAALWLHLGDLTWHDGWLLIIVCL